MGFQGEASGRTPLAVIILTYVVFSSVLMLAGIPYAYGATDTTGGASASGLPSSGTVYAFPITITGSGIVQTVGINWAGTQSGNVMVALYSNGPVNLLTQSSSTAMSGSAGWQDVPVTSSYSITPGSYMLAIQFDASRSVNYVGGTRYYYSKAYGSFDSTWSSSTSADGAAQWNMRITYVAADFTLTHSPTSQTITAGSTASTTLSLSALGSFAGTVTLTVASGCPPGVTCTISPSSVSSFPGTATLSVPTLSSTTGTFLVVATGTSGSLSHSVTFTVTVTPVVGPSISANPSTVPVAAPGSGTSTLTLIGFPSSGTVNLGVSGCPTAVTCTVSPSSLTLPGQTTSTLTLTTSAIAATGSYSVTVSATGAATAQVTVTVSITGASRQDFTVHAGATQVVVTATWTGQSAIATFTLLGPSNNPTLSETGQTVFNRLLVSGSTNTYIHKVSFNITPYTPGSTQTWTAVISLTGTYTVTIDVNSPTAPLEEE